LRNHFSKEKSRPFQEKGVSTPAAKGGPKKKKGLKNKQHKTTRRKDMSKKPKREGELPNKTPERKCQDPLKEGGGSQKRKKKKKANENYHEGVSLKKEKKR